MELLQSYRRDIGAKMHKDVIDIVFRYDYRGKTMKIVKEYRNIYAPSFATGCYERITKVSINWRTMPCKLQRIYSLRNDEIVGELPKNY